MEEQINNAAVNIEKNKIKKKSGVPMPSFNLFLFVLVVIFVGANQVLVNMLNDKLGISYDLKNEINKIAAGEKIPSKTDSASNEKIELAGDINKDIEGLIRLKGVPAVYGPEMGVSFDDVQGAINVMKQFDPFDLKPKGKRIIPQGENLARYIAITGKISCEYCCSAKSIINPKNGQYACGCAHSMAMRGLAAYLLEKHGNEYSNDEILRELARWKGMYFPKQMKKKIIEQLQSGTYTPDIAAILLNLELPKYSESSGGVPAPSDIEDLPNMVGGC